MNVKHLRLENIKKPPAKAGGTNKENLKNKTQLK
jgi:hypothetical protein